MRILFIAWDGPYVNYLDGLFLPIFSGLKKYGYEFHILHFTWADKQSVDAITESCKKENIPYRHVKVWTWPLPVIGKYLTLLQAHRHALKFIAENNIEVIMPRTTMPARIALTVLRYKPNLKLIFDADGLPIEEHVDFAGLKKGSFWYNQLKKIEKEIVAKAELILCRSSKAIEFLVQQYGEDKRSKFHVVINGRNESMFQRSVENEIAKTKESLVIPPDCFVAVYSGSLGPQYGVDQMLYLHEMLLRWNPNAYLLILTGNPGYLSRRLPKSLHHVLIKRVLVQEVPRYLSIANIAFALRKAAFSMQGVSPIKLGEYLLIGLPVIASAGIGDTEDILQNKPFCFVLNDFSEASLDKAVDWIIHRAANTDPQDARQCGEAFFGLRKAVESYRLALLKLNA